MHCSSLGVETEIHVAQGARGGGGTRSPGRVPFGEGSLEGGSHHPALDGLRWAPVSHQGHRGLVLRAGQEAAQLGHLQGKGRWSAPRQTKWTHNACDRVRNPWLLNKISKQRLPPMLGPELVGEQSLVEQAFPSHGKTIPCRTACPGQSLLPGSETVRFTEEGTMSVQSVPVSRLHWVHVGIHCSKSTRN